MLSIVLNVSLTFMSGIFKVRLNFFFGGGVLRSQSDYYSLKGTLCHFREEILAQNCYIYNYYLTIEVVIQTQKHIYFSITG